MINKQYMTIQAWKDTKYNLKLLAAIRGETMSATLHKIVSDALEAKQKRDQDQGDQSEI